MIKKIVFAVLPFAAFIAFSACESNRTNENNGEITDTTVSTDKDTITVFHERVNREREDWKTTAQREIDSAEAYISRMDDKMKNKKGDAKNDWEKTKADLRKRIDNTKADLNAAANKADNEWDEFKIEVKARLDTLRKEWNQNTDNDVDVKVEKK